MPAGDAVAMITGAVSPPMPSTAKGVATVRENGGLGTTTTGSAAGRTTPRWPNTTASANTSGTKGNGSSVLPTTTWFSI